MVPATWMMKEMISAVMKILATREGRMGALSLAMTCMLIGVKVWMDDEHRAVRGETDTQIPRAPLTQDDIIPGREENRGE